MHKLISIAAMFAFAGTLFAQSPFVGTWKLDTAKTRYTIGEPPKDGTLVINEQGDNLQVTATVTNADGSTSSLKYTVPLKGGAAQVQKGAYDAINSRAISANVRENRFSKNGKEISSRRLVVSGDGKTLRSTVKGTTAAGTPVKGVDVLEKQ